MSTRAKDDLILIGALLIVVGLFMVAVVKTSKKPPEPVAVVKPQPVECEVTLRVSDRETHVYKGKVK